MNLTKNAYGLYALALGVAVVGALAFGVSAEALILLAIVAACPLMMLFMMHGMHDGHSGRGRHIGQADPPHEHEPHQSGPSQP
ncbi:DUF2933 domain-containing protein [Streptosporangium sp. NPDC000396]|uniref:DUF2933 domain-containing protein n=1 Tax=Streptosporangium sp. NPDC000396 TaxID=3366185 RepID=UPI0036B14620